MAKATKTKAKQPTVGQGDRSDDTRINAVLETLRAVRAEDCGDFWNALRNGKGARRLAKRLEVPFLLLVFVDDERSNLSNTSMGLSPADVDEWEKWPGRRNLMVEEFVDGLKEA